MQYTSDHSALKYVTEQIDKNFLLVARFPTVSVVFLEIPPYIIKEWNRTQGHPNPERFDSQNKILSERISLVNEYIKEVNSI